MCTSERSRVYSRRIYRPDMIGDRAGGSRRLPGTTRDDEEGWWTVLELAILGLLHESPMYGYELRKRLTDLPGAFRECSFGLLSPALKRKQAHGMIRAA